MIYIHMIVALMAILYCLSYYFIKKDCINTTTLKSKICSNDIALITIFIVALIIRIICGYNYDLHTDIGCFKYWADHMYEVGSLKFYSTASFADYPPGYMYILWFVSFIKDIFNIDTFSSMGTLMIKSPAIIFDLITGFIIYKIAKKHFNDKVSLICLMMYIFNPIVIFNSAVWGQVDSVFGLGIFLMCYFIYCKETKYAYICYGLAALIKPQAFLFTPILLFGIFDELFFDKDKKTDKIKLKFNKVALREQAVWCIGSILIVLLIAAPFGLGTVFKTYVGTMGSYEYASVNAYNFWSMLGLDWIPQDNIAFGLKYQTWGTIAILLICIMSVIFFFAKTKDRTRYFTIAIFIAIAMFTFSVRMHERYVYPGVVMLLLLFIVNKQYKVLWLYAAFSIGHFYNIAHVLFYYDPQNFDRRNPVIIVVSMLQVALCICFIKYCYDVYIGNKVKYNTVQNDAKEKQKKKGKKVSSQEKAIIKKIFSCNTIEKTEEFTKLSKIDWIIMIVITIIYACIAFYDLGDKDAPQSFWKTDKQYSNIDIELPEGSVVGNVDFYLGNYEERTFTLYLSQQDLGNIGLKDTMDIDSDSTEQTTDSSEVLTDLIMDSVFCWDSWEINKQANYIRIISDSDKCVIGELVIKDINGNIITPINVDAKELKGLFDEQAKLPEKFSFRNSTYFDEIYHARTAYEYIEGLYSYENTHPPLGKYFISLGMRLFGVCPFGWRFAGTLFGVLMVPCIYLFAKQLFKKTNIATIGCLLYTFDFMHFAQTRIATIDVFVTFFVILMYYFMYLYYKMSFYDTKLWKTFIPLGLSAISMGLGCASKWTGVYAGLGLAVIFFYTVIKRYKEYRYALSNEYGETNGIKHKDIISTFKKKLGYTLAYCVATFVILAGTIYTLSYIPFVSGYITPDTENYAIGRLVDDLVTGEDAVFERDSLVGKMLANQYTMYSYHKEVEFEHAYSSRWYEWALLIRPIWYYSGIEDGNYRQGISAMGNPIVWWLGIPAFMYMIYLWYNKKDKIAMFLSIGYLAQMIPWVPIERLTFIYHYFPSVPFVTLMLTYSIYKIIESKNEEGKIIDIQISNGVDITLNKTGATYVAYGIVAIAIVLFVMFYPILAGQTVNGEYVDTWLRWLDTWVFISY